MFNVTCSFVHVSSLRLFKKQLIIVNIQMYLPLDSLFDIHKIVTKWSLCVAQLANFADLASLQNYIHQNFLEFSALTHAYDRQKNLYEVKIRDYHITAIQSNEYIDHIFH